MDIFNYHPITGAFLSVGEAGDNPLDPADPIVPGYATRWPLPELAEGYAAVYRDIDGGVPQTWTEGHWVAIRDYRNVPLFSTENGQRLALEDANNGLGDLPSNVTTLERPSAAHKWVDGAWQLDAALAEALARQANVETRAGLLAVAREVIEPWQIAVEIGEATDGEQAKLLAWKRYIVALSRIDLLAPAWPEVPAR